jgi:heme/copper-type cytochrome/quinol oxidase subunit 2
MKKNLSFLIKAYKILIGLMAWLIPVSAKAITILPDTDPATWKLEDINGMIENIITLAADLAGGIAIIFLIWAAIQYFTAFGNEEKANKAKTTITWAIVGLVLIILARILTSEIINLVH